MDTQFDLECFSSIVLTYAIVEAQENLKNYEACYEAFNSLIQYYHSEIDEINKTIEKEIAHGIPIIESKTATTLPDGEADQELTEEEKQCIKEEEQLRANITALYKPKIDEFREAAASVWITELRFARRTEVCSYCILSRILFIREISHRPLFLSLSL